MSFLGGIIGGLVGKIVVFFLFVFGAKRAGERDQQRKDLETANKEDRDARKIENDTSRLSDSELDKRLRRP